MEIPDTSERCSQVFLKRRSGGLAECLTIAIVHRYQARITKNSQERSCGKEGGGVKRMNRTKDNEKSLK
jgi:hypothetical protein